ncbi:Hsp20/alpha crystallin family protein [Candidatus Uhrbacteria bacterium]|jgi:HSP20 family protein|nr:Hsp20/alpha crystallin family protein [Candidatus Uhrbacteria bacterium]MBT7717008.1 Hsp20/alpha crystallin family protein [Candidatus Uhrbacteria bacterium]
MDDQLWESQEGQLAVDVLETPSEIIIRSAIAGVKPKDIDINVTSDLVTIRGERERHRERHDTTMHFEECFWGSFSRSIVLPAHVQPNEANADMKNGVLTLTIPKAHAEMQVPVREDLSD